ncbi:hypothetical protein ACQ86G_22850 [Roseateles chitinivorans]|uniref:hypothetical protein n=1 Tax=Roseateles chitinivorans TaxID=2917965 RepID=UPI003D66A249
MRTIDRARQQAIIDVRRLEQAFVHVNPLAAAETFVDLTSAAAGIEMVADLAKPTHVAPAFGIFRMHTGTGDLLDDGLMPETEQLHLSFIRQRAEFPLGPLVLDEDGAGHAPPRDVVALPGLLELRVVQEHPAMPGISWLGVERTADINRVGIQRDGVGEFYGSCHYFSFFGFAARLERDSSTG